MNKWNQVTLVFTAIVLISGCNQTKDSYDSQGPDSSVAVVRAHDSRQKNIEYVTFRSIDGKRIKCDQSCPLTVRVSPGAHTFILKVKSNFDDGTGTTFSFETEVPTSVKNVQAGKIYTIKYN